MDAKSWPLILDVDDLPSGKRKNHLELPERKSSDVCYLVSELIIERKITVAMDRSMISQDFSVSTTGQLSGVGVSYAGAISICKSLKVI